MNKIKYVHSELQHNLKAPSVIVPLLIELMQPKSVVDVGCGIGTFLHVFKKNGVNNILGLDGKWVNQELLFKHISHNEFVECDFEKPIELNKKFDLAISLEVAEHLPTISADQFVNSLTKLSNIVLFSAAIPFQLGQNHVNLQWPQYWVNKFINKDYRAYDIRPIFWENENVDHWYSQNMILFVKNGVDFDFEKLDKYIKQDGRILSYVHPERYDELNSIIYKPVTFKIMMSVIKQYVKHLFFTKK